MKTSFYVQFKEIKCEELKKFVLNKEENILNLLGRDCDVKTISCKWEETLELENHPLYKFSESIGKSFKWRISPMDQQL